MDKPDKPPEQDNSESLEADTNTIVEDCVHIEFQEMMMIAYNSDAPLLNFCHPFQINVSSSSSAGKTKDYNNINIYRQTK